MALEGPGRRPKVGAAPVQETKTKDPSSSVDNRGDSTSSPEAGGRSAGGRPAAGISALQKVLGHTAPTKKGGQGAKAALVGLHAVQPRPKTGIWRAAVVTALIGLNLVGMVARTDDLIRGLQQPQRVELVMPMPSSPTFQLSAREAILSRQTVLPPIKVEMVDTAPPDVTMPDLASQLVFAVAADTLAPATAVDTAVDTVTADQLRIERPPQTLTSLRNGMTVVQGTDPGDFYCEHAFFTSTAEALRAGTSILTNRQGEVMTGFLHVPGDDFTYDTSKTPVQAERHADRREIVGAAIRGFYEDARLKIDGDKPFQMLITGYAQWGGVVNNPTGDFVVHQDNIDAAMQNAFGTQLASPTGKVVEHSADGERTRLQYQIEDATTGKVRTILVEAARLPVTDDAIDGGPQSLQTRIREFQPHAVMSMGVAGGSSSYQAEFHADDGGLGLKDGRVIHDDAKSPAVNHPDNFSLGRAIRTGHQIVNPGGAAPGGVVPGGAGAGLVPGGV